MRNLAGDPTTKEYWNDRVKKITDPKDMLFLDGRREEFWDRVRLQLSQWGSNRVLDVCCGYGQFAPIFWDYTGIDFSEEMIKLAKEKNPAKESCFLLQDVKEYEGAVPYDIVFEVNSLRSLNMTAEQFIEKFKPYAKRAVACLEADQFIIHQIYGTDKR